MPFNGDDGEDFYDKFGVPKDIDIPEPQYEPVYHPEPEVEEEEEDEEEDGEDEMEGDEGEMEEGEGEDEEEEEELEVEPYMTKEYYMPGYVDTTPEKDYPPHIRAFKNYIGSIGDF